MNNISIPFCHLPNSRVQVFNENCKRTEFQIKTLKEISNRDSFDHFVLMYNNIGYPLIVEPNYKSKFFQLWYEKDGTFHGLFIGQKKLLNSEIIIEGKSFVPVDKNHPAYRQLCDDNVDNYINLKII